MIDEEYIKIDTLSYYHQKVIGGTMDYGKVTAICPSCGGRIIEKVKPILHKLCTKCEKKYIYGGFI